MMSELDSAFWKRITQIVQKENRPFSYLDFVPKFEVYGQSYSIAYGTFRNKVSDMLKAGKIQLVCYSPQAFYTLKALESEIAMTGYHTGVPSALNQQRYRHLSNDPVYRIIQNLPLGRRSLHDIRLGFKVNGIWSILAPRHKPDLGNNGIRLEPWPYKITCILAVNVMSCMKVKSVKESFMLTQLIQIGNLYQNGIVQSIQEPKLKKHGLLLLIMSAANEKLMMMELI